ncbi:MAG: polysaccharide deacetylase family protein [Ruminococcus sp.]|nr:polysaccharide deacetylase family protein [Ruminococcus sp.]
MNKLKASICVLLAVITLAGCATQATSTHPTESTAYTTQAATTQVITSEATTAPHTTVAPTTQPVSTTVAETIVYQPVADNKVSSDYEQDPTEAPAPKPSKPAKPLSTDDEATAPATKPAQKPTDNKKYKYIAFTFDDGPHYELTYKFADKLAEYGGVGTFYVVGNRIHGEQAKAMKYAYDLGNEIGIHGYTHEYYYDSCSDSKFKSELSKTAKLIKDITGEKPLTMRPIGGGITSSRVKSSGYVVVNWNVDSNDWRYTGRGSSKNSNINTIYNNVIKATDENDIILFHEIYYNSYDAFCKVIDKLYKKGYRFVTVSQLLGVDDDDRGKFFYSAD